MNWFKRLCMFVFGLCGVLALAALSLVWVGPWTATARTLITENRLYFVTLEVLVCVSAAGLLACILVSLFAPRNARETTVAQVQGGAITVTRTAIVSQTRHIIEADGTCSAGSIRVSMRKRGNIRVHVRVVPHKPVDVIERGEVLYAALESGLAKVCGESVKSIGIVFTEPEQAGTMADYIDASNDASAPTPTTTATGTPAHDIVVHMPPREEAAEPVMAEPAPAAPEPTPTPESASEVFDPAATGDKSAAETLTLDPLSAQDDAAASQTEEV